VGKLVQSAYGATLLRLGVHRGVFAVELGDSAMWRGIVLVRLKDSVAFWNAMTAC